MPLNEPLIRQLQAIVLANPHDYDMGPEVDDVSKTNVIEPEQSCGYACCFAGWTSIILRNLNPVELFNNLYRKTVYNRPFSPVLEAEEALGLTPIQSESVFYSSMWPQEFMSRYHNASSDEERAQAGADRLEYLIQTGK